MLRTDDRIVETELVDWKNVVGSIVTQLTEIFPRYPDWFFTEHDIHSVLHNVAKEELQRNGFTSVKTLDKHQVMLSHHEYPTPFRCDMQGYKFRRVSEEERTSNGGLYRRGHYDLVIFNPEFVKSNKLDVVCGKDYQKFKLAMRKVEVEPLIWACEVIFFPRVNKLPKNAFKIIEQDALKVKETLRYRVGQNRHFCKLDSILVFTSHTTKEVSNLKTQIAELSQKHGLHVILSASDESLNLDFES